MDFKSFSRPILDLHVHVGPELIKRKYTMDSLAEEADASGIGFAAKNHFRTTTADAARLSDKVKIPVVGSVTLNLAVGGINAQAIRGALSGCKRNVAEAELDPGRFIVWMPTIHAEAHLAHNGRLDIRLEWGGVPRYQTRFSEGGGLRVFDGGALSGRTLEVLDLLAAEDLVLATGHLSGAEVEALVPAAVERGVRRIILTHPLYETTALSPAAQRDLCRLKGVYAELSYSNLDIDNMPVETYAEVIRIVGVEKIILSSDLGQTNRPTITDGWRDYYVRLSRQGITAEDFEVMAAANPHTIVYGESLA
jgi:hypothetical protein